jgi:hypothetical protein
MTTTPLRSPQRFCEVSVISDGTLWVLKGD